MKLGAAASICVGLGVLGLLLRAASKRKPNVLTLPTLVVRPPPQPNAPPRAWKPITSKLASIKAGNAYAGVVQLTGLHATLGSASAVESKLRELCEWTRLEVSDKPIVARFPVPWATQAIDDRYWALGVAASSAPAVEVPDEVVQLFER